MTFDYLSLKRQEINKNFDGIELNATLKKNASLVDFIGFIKGDIARCCDRCLENHITNINIDYNFKISNTINNKNDDVMYEFTDNKIDIDFIIQSEINAIKSDYFICNTCKQEEDFEINI